MAASDAIPFPIKNQAYRLQVEFFNTTTGITHSGGALADLAATIIKDGAEAVASTNALTQVGTDGICYLDLTAAEMNYSSIVVQCTSSTSSVACRPTEIRLADTSEPTGRWDAQDVKRMEQILVQLFADSFNKQSAVSGTRTLYKNDETTEMLEGTYTESPSSATFGEMGTP